MEKVEPGRLGGAESQGLSFNSVELILDGDVPTEESDAVEVMLSWKQARTNINMEKIAGGFPSGERQSRPDVKKLQARARCFNCKQKLSEESSRRRRWISRARWARRDELCVVRRLLFAQAAQQVASREGGSPLTILRVRQCP